MAESPETRAKEILKEMKVEEDKRARAMAVLTVQLVTPLTATDDQRRQYKPQFDAIDDADRNLARLRQELSTLQLVMVKESIEKLNQGVDTLNGGVTNLKTATDSAKEATKEMSRNTKRLVSSSNRLEAFTLLLVVLAVASIYVAESKIISFYWGLVVIGGIISLMGIDVYLAYKNRQLLKSD